MADGFEENVEFFTLTYEAPLRVASPPRVREDRAAALAAGRVARAADRRHLDAGWDVADAYGVLADLDQSDDVPQGGRGDARRVAIAFIVTDEDRLFESIVARPARPRRAGAAVRGVPAQLRDRGREGRAVKFTLKDYQAEAVDDLLANLERARS